MSEQEVYEALRYRIVVNEYGTRIYYNGAGQLHRENGPAVEYPYGFPVWYQNGRLHRENGPAVEWADGSKEWWLNGEELTEEEFNRAVKQNA